MIGIFALLAVLMCLVIKFCQKVLKVVLSSIIILLTLYCTVLSIDINMVNSFRQPVFIVPSDNVDDNGSGTYYGLGYRVEMEKHLSAEYGIKIEKVEIYMFDRVIAAAIE